MLRLGLGRWLYLGLWVERSISWRSSTYSVPQRSMGYTVHSLGCEWVVPRILQGIWNVESQ